MAEPYYEDESVTLYLGDCLEILPTLGVTADLMVTDPPYGVAWKSGRGAHSVLAGDDGSLDLNAFLKAACRVLRRGRHAYIFGYGPNDFGADVPLCAATELIWDKGVTGLGDIESAWGPAHERITFAVQEISKANRAKGYGVVAARLRKGSVLHVQRPHSGQTLRHPTEKPVQLLRILIESSSTFGELVLDPFAGSGTTLWMALGNGRDSIGVDLDERNAELARERVGPMYLDIEGI
jgi:DNA modification methylase